MTTRTAVRLAKLESVTPGNEWKEYRGRPISEWPDWALTTSIIDGLEGYQHELDDLVAVGLATQEAADRARDDALTFVEWEQRTKDLPVAHPLQDEYTEWLTSACDRLTEMLDGAHPNRSKPEGAKWT